jgi:hypothetical protein
VAVLGASEADPLGAVELVEAGNRVDKL